MLKIDVCAHRAWVVLSLLSIGLAAAEPAFVPKNGFVPDRATAVKIAEAILVPIYGEQVLKQRPFKATLSRDRWIVEGTFHQAKGEVLSGGVALIEIKQSTGEILQVIHGK